MIAQLQGKLVDATPTQIVVDCNGVGYAVFIPLSSYNKLPAKGGNITILTYHHVIPREGTQQLFGFMTREEREMFQLLINVTGIGPKLALNILSGSALTTLRSMIASGDAKSLAALPGIGKKTSERLVVELREKVGPATELAARGREATPQERKVSDAVLALVALGLKQAEAHHAVLATLEKLGPDVALEELVRNALRNR